MFQLHIAINDTCSAYARKSDYGTMIFHSS